MHCAHKVARRVLLVDDDLDTLEVTAELLRLCGHEVVAARSGDHALAVATHYRPDVALLDLAMPGMDGYVLADKLKAALSFAPPRVIALSGYADAASLERAHRAGFDRHLAKPVMSESLLEAIEDDGARRALVPAPRGQAALR